MYDVIPDLPRFFLDEIKKQERKPDGLLHPSGDLIGSLRHSMLRAAGAPRRERPIAQDIRLMHGTLWHEWFHAALEKAHVNFQYEVDVTPWLPEGWSGTADWLFWVPEYQAWVLADLKTTKGESIFYLKKDGAKDEHIWQISAYYWALVHSGRPMLNTVAIMYWPMNDTNDSVDVEPVLNEIAPINEDVILPVMQSRWDLTQEYLSRVAETGNYVNDLLAPEQDREQKISWNAKQKVFDVKLVPHWSARFCDYPDYCDCSQQGTNKIGHWTLDKQWDQRDVDVKDFPWDIVRPDDSAFERKAKELDANRNNT
jgi:hypothetical protein